MKLITILLLLNFAAVTFAADGNCAVKKLRCKGDDCCSMYNYCGTGKAYCGAGCQSGFGRCDSVSPKEKKQAKPKPLLTDKPVLKLTENGQCFNNGRKCHSNACCSEHGWCGDSKAHCGSGCKTGFGRCDSVSPAKKTAGASEKSSKGSESSKKRPVAHSPTSSGKRSRIQVVKKCTEKGTVAFTFDDGPHKQTEKISKAFKKAGGRVTFFVNGENWGSIYTFAKALKIAFEAGHQIASHTFYHPHLIGMTATDVIADMELQHASLMNIIGVIPTYFRPPYGEYNGTTLQTIGDLGYTKFVMWDIDSGDSNPKVSIDQQKATYTKADPKESHIFLNHETYESTADILVPVMIKWAQDNNLKMVTVAECLGETIKDMYRTEEMA